jgi:putative endonuclease
MSDRRRQLGDLGERLARDHLIERGFKVLDTNYRCPIGEIDIVAEDGDDLVFVEVRTRRGRELGTPEESITKAKKERLISLAQTYLQEKGVEQRQYRIDLVAVAFSKQGALERVELIENAVEG